MFSTIVVVFVFIYIEVLLLFMPKYLVLRDMVLCQNYKIYLLFLSIVVYSTSRDSLAGIATKLRTELLRSRGFIPGRGQEISLFSIISRPTLGPSQPHTQSVPGLFPGVNRQGRESDH
jgi:hypothetical protein